MQSSTPLTKRICPACGGGFLLAVGVARCPHCNHCVSAAGAPAGASSLRASDRAGYRFLGQHGGQRRGRRETPFVVRGQKPDPQALAIREAQQQSLAEKQAYWKAEIAVVEDEYGPLDAGVWELLRG